MYYGINGTDWNYRKFSSVSSQRWTSLQQQKTSSVLVITEVNPLRKAIRIHKCIPINLCSVVKTKGIDLATTNPPVITTGFGPQWTFRKLYVIKDAIMSLIELWHGGSLILALTRQFSVM